MSLYERVSRLPDGGRALAVARLQRTVLQALDKALTLSRINSQSDLARRLRIRKSAVNQVLRGDGNVKIRTLAEYLYELGFEADLNLVEAGEHRLAVVEGRAPRQLSAGERGALEVTVSVSARPEGVAASVSSRLVEERKLGIQMTITNSWFSPQSESAGLTADLVTA